MKQETSIKGQGTIKITSISPEETQHIGEMLGEEIVASAIEEPVVIALEGELGAGKTTFVKGLAQGLEISANVISPTFILMGTYKGPAYTLYHIDPYRLEKPETLKDDIHELLQQKYAVIAIEWAAKLKKILPKKIIWVKSEHKKETERDITFS